jgi:hypothetical protein
MRACTDGIERGSGTPAPSTVTDGSLSPFLLLYLTTVGNVTAVTNASPRLFPLPPPQFVPRILSTVTWPLHQL